MNLLALKFVAAGLISVLLLIAAMFAGLLAEHWRARKRKGG